MKMTLQATIAVVLVLLFSPSGVVAESEVAQSAVDGFSLESLSWMAGHWRFETTEAGRAKRVTEEIWMAPAAGLMLAVNRDQIPDRPAFFEFLRIEEGPDGITFWASPKGAPATPFRMVEQGSKKAVFENPEHDFPQRILYWLDDQGRLHGRAEATVDGKVRGSEWVWEKVKAP